MKMKTKITLVATLIIITMLLISSCQAFQTLPSATPEIQTEAPETAQQRSPTEITKEPGPIVTPTATPIIPSSQGTPLPKRLETIRVENVERIQHLATWGIGSPKVIQLSEDGQVLAVGTGSGVHFYDTQGLYELAFRETPHSVMSIAFSQENEYIAVGQVEGIIDIYNRLDFSFVTRLDISDVPFPELYSLDCFFFQGVSKLVCVIQAEEKIFIKQWSTDDWGQITTFEIDNGLTTFINPAIASIGVISKDSLFFQSLLVMEDKDEIELPKFFSEDFWENFILKHGDIAPTADGEGLMINNGSSIIYWEILSEDITYQLTEYPSSLPDPCHDVAETCLNPNGEISWVCRETAPPPIETIALTPDNIMVLVARNDDILQLRRVKDGLLAWEVEVNYTKIRFSPGSEFFFGLREDGTIEKRLSEDGTLVGMIDQHPGKLTDIAFSPDGEEIAAALNNGWIHIYNTANGQSLGFLDGNAQSLDFSPDGSLLAAGLPNGTIRVFSLTSSGYFDLVGHFDSVNDIKFSENGRILLSGSADCTISLWDIKDRKRTQTIIPGKEEPFEVLRVDFSPAEVLGYVVGDISGLYASKEDAKVVLKGFVSVKDLAISENKQTLAVTGSGTSVYTEIQEKGFSLSNSLSVKGNALALNEDGSLLVVATEESLEFWSTENRTRIHTITFKDPGFAGNAPIRLLFSPDNRVIVVGYQSGLIDIFGLSGN
jgi:WD40 repeat protein